MASPLRTSHTKMIEPPAYVKEDVPKMALASSDTSVTVICANAPIVDIIRRQQGGVSSVSIEVALIQSDSFYCLNRDAWGHSMGTFDTVQKKVTLRKAQFDITVEQSESSSPNQRDHSIICTANAHHSSSPHHEIHLRNIREESKDSSDRHNIIMLSADVEINNIFDNVLPPQRINETVCCIRKFYIQSYVCNNKSSLDDIECHNNKSLNEISNFAINSWQKVRNQFRNSTNKLLPWKHDKSINLIEQVFVRDRSKSILTLKTNKLSPNVTMFVSPLTDAVMNNTSPPSYEEIF